MAIKDNLRVIWTGVIMAVTAIAAVVSWWLFPSSLGVAGISVSHVLAFGVGLMGCFVALKAIWQNGHLSAQLERLQDSARKKIEQLEGIAHKVEHFFDGRECEKNWQDCGRVLALHAMDARKHGLYDSAQFAEERLVVPLKVAEKEGAVDVFVHLSSMMRRKRHARPAPEGWESVKNFQGA